MSTDGERLPTIRWDEPDYDYDLVKVDGRPFTGYLVDYHDDGRLASRRLYKDGLPEGLGEEWYPDGQLATRSDAIRGNGVSEMWKWYPNGQLWKYRRNQDDLFAVEIKEWSEQGQLTKDEQYAPPTTAA